MEVTGVKFQDRTTEYKMSLSERTETQCYEVLTQKGYSFIRRKAVNIVERDGEEVARKAIVEDFMPDSDLTSVEQKCRDIAAGVFTDKNATAYESAKLDDAAGQ